MRIDGSLEDWGPVGDVAVGPQGQLAVVQRQLLQVHVYDADGRRVGVAGGRGQGPGELMGVGPVGWSADSLWVFDRSESRFLIFDEDLTFVRVIRVPSVISTGDARMRVSFERLLADGGLVGEVREAARDGEGQIRSFLEVEQDGSSFRTFARQEAESGSVRTQVGDTYVGTTIPFFQDVFAAFSPDGRRLALVEAFIEGPLFGTFSASMMDLRGDTIFSYRYPFSPSPIPGPVRDEAASRARTGLRDVGVSGNANLFMDLPIPEFYPPVRRVVVGDDYSLWVGVEDAQDELVYRVIGPGGEPVASVVLPDGQVIANADAATVWAYEWDALGVPSLVRYTVR